jgi:hypothetical protein
VSGGVARSAAQAAARPAADPAGEAHSTLARSRTNARWAGAITGSTFYIGMIPALLLIYCEQLAIVLKIAAIHGKDPCDAARIAEFLVIQGRYGSTAEAADALARLGAPAAGRRVGRLHRGVAVIRQLPELIGLTLRRIRNPLDAIIVAVEILSFFVPVVSIPIWAYANARATRRLGTSAIAYYANAGSTAAGTTPRHQAMRPPPKRLRLLLILVWCALAAVAALLPLGSHAARALPLGGRLLAEAALAATFGRLLVMTRRG